MTQSSDNTTIRRPPGRFIRDRRTTTSSSEIRNSKQRFNINSGLGSGDEIVEQEKRRRDALIKSLSETSAEDSNAILQQLSDLRESVINIHAAKTNAGGRAGGGQTDDTLLDDVEPVRIGDLVYLEASLHIWRNMRVGQ